MSYFKDFEYIDETIKLASQQELEIITERIEYIFGGINRIFVSTKFLEHNVVIVDKYEEWHRLMKEENGHAYYTVFPKGYGTIGYLIASTEKGFFGLVASKEVFNDVIDAYWEKVSEENDS